MESILIVAGEKSGERYGADLIREFHRLRPEAGFFGIGGQGMRAEGAELLFDIRDLELVGIFEILSHIPRLMKIRRDLKREVRSRRPSAAVLIDSPDFNLRLAPALRRLSIPVLYYVSPTVWAWRRNRLRRIRRTVDRMLLIFPFEKSIYDKHGIPAVYIGHPLLERLPSPHDRRSFFDEYGLDASRPLLALLPGSRPSEIINHMPTLMRAVRRLRDSHTAQSILVLADHFDESLVAGHIPPDLKDHLKILRSGDDGYRAISAADAALSACGTVNLEAALLETPLVAFYRISPLTYRLGRPFVRINRFSIVNILADGPVVPELIQNDFTEENLVRETERILNSEACRDEMVRSFRAIRQALGSHRASHDAARQLSLLIGGMDSA